MVRKYDEQILKIQKQRARAIELDTFMRTDKTVKELIKQLPKEDTVEMVNNFCAYCNGDDCELEMEDMALMYCSDTIGEHSGKDGTFIQIQDEKGEIDKKGIVEWLKGIAEKVSNK